jgi:hypothetical protein
MTRDLLLAACQQGNTTLGNTTGSCVLGCTTTYGKRKHIIGETGETFSNASSRVGGEHNAVERCRECGRGRVVRGEGGREKERKRVTLKTEREREIRERQRASEHESGMTGRRFIPSSAHSLTKL